LWSIRGEKQLNGVGEERKQPSEIGVGRKQPFEVGMERKQPCETEMKETTCREGRGKKGSRLAKWEEWRGRQPLWSRSW
jgi:hypothetical protein